MSSSDRKLTIVTLILRQSRLEAGAPGKRKRKSGPDRGRGPGGSGRLEGDMKIRGGQAPRIFIYRLSRKISS